jgi:hypothetical protein
VGEMPRWTRAEFWGQLQAAQEHAAEAEAKIGRLRAAMKPIVDRLEEVRAKDEAGWLLPDEWIDDARAALAEGEA